MTSGNISPRRAHSLPLYCIHFLSPKFQLYYTWRNINYSSIVYSFLVRDPAAPVLLFRYRCPQKVILSMIQLLAMFWQHSCKSPTEMF